MNTKKIVLFIGVLLLGGISIGYTLASVLPFPASLPVAISGNIIRASDINTLVSASQSLEQRSLKYNAAENRIEIPLNAQGNARSAGTEIYFTNSGSVVANGGVSANTVASQVLSLTPYTTINALPASASVGSIAYVQNKGLYFYTGTTWNAL